MVNLDFKCIRITITFLSADKTSTETATVTTERISMFHLKRIMSGRKFEVDTLYWKRLLTLGKFNTLQRNGV